MGRVEQRMYRRRQKRAKRVRLLLLIVLLAGAGLLLSGMNGSDGFLAQRLTSSTPDPLNSDFDKTVQTRDVMLPEESWYAIQTGVFSSEEAALQKADTYASRGAPGTVIRSGEKWRVFIACYGSESDAMAVRERIAEHQRVETYLYTWTCPELHLRMSGLAGQLDMAEAGLTLLQSTASQLRDTATLLDAGQLTPQDAVAVIDDVDSRMRLWADTTASRFNKPYPALIAGLLAQSDAWQGRSTEIHQAAASATNLSAAMKTHGMHMYQAMISLRASIDQGT